MISLAKRRPGEGFETVLDFRITMVKSLITSGGEVHMLVVVGQNFPQASPVEVSHNNDSCLGVSFLQSSNYSIQSVKCTRFICLGGDVDCSDND